MSKQACWRLGCTLVGVALCSPSVSSAPVTPSVSSAPVPSVSPPEWSEKRVDEFIAAIGKVDRKTLSDFYASQVRVIGGSELLKPKWKVVEGDPRKDAEVDSSKLIEGYAKLAAKIGDNWTKMWLKISKDNKKVAITKIVSDDEMIKGTRSGDYFLKIVPETDQDGFIYVFRAIGLHGRWQVVIEGADY